MILSDKQKRVSRDLNHVTPLTAQLFPTRYLTRKVYSLPLLGRDEEAILC